MVRPDLDTPGKMAAAWATPIQSASPRPRGESRDGAGRGGGSVSGRRRGPPEVEEDRPGQHQAAGREADAAERVMDLVLERDPDDRCRNRRCEQEADEPPAGPNGVPALGSGSADSDERAQQSEDFAAEVDQRGGQRSQMNHDLE